MVAALAIPFVEALDNACRRHPKRIAAENCGVSKERLLTYEALDTGSRILANELISAGVRKHAPAGGTGSLEPRPSGNRNSRTGLSWGSEGVCDEPDAVDSETPG